jgi:hypothetical protein
MEDRRDDTAGGDATTESSSSLSCIRKSMMSFN